MNETLVLLGIGFILILSLAFLLIRGRVKRDDISRPSGKYSRPPSGQVEDHRKQQLDRIFGREDWDYIRSNAPARVQRLFLRERKSIALAWVSERRSEVQAFMDLHVARVRASEELQVALEIKLAADYYVFQAKCGIIAAIILLSGPTALRGMVGQAESLSEMLKGMSKADLKTETFSRITGIR